MITFHPVSFNEALEKAEYLPLFKSLCINEMEVADVISYLSNTPLMEALDYDGTHLGMLSVEPVEELGVEVHAYVPPLHRKRSRELLGAFKEALFTLTPFTFIRTTVTEDFKPLVRFLGFIGFDLIETRSEAVKKGGQLYDLFVLQTNKGE